MKNTGIERLINLIKWKQGVLHRLESLKKNLCSRTAACVRMRAAGFLAGACALVWWCVLYPELCFPQDTYEAVYEGAEESEKGGTAGAEGSMEREGVEACPDMEGAECGKAVPTEGNFRGLLQAEEEQVIVKSRLLEWLEGYRGE